jgi:hypothetical protein
VAMLDLAAVGDRGSSSSSKKDVTDEKNDMDF